MDNFTHSLAGWALGQAGLKKTTRKGLAALILGANMPDIDVIFGWVPWVPLATHRGVTHGIGGMVVQPFLLAGALWALDRWQVSRGATFNSGLPMRFGWLLLLSMIGLATHPLLDFQNTYGVQLLSPWSDRWFAGDTLFIIDVWIWTALTFAIWLSRRREKRGQAWRRPMWIAILGVTAYISANCALSLIAERATERQVEAAVRIDGAPARFRDLPGIGYGGADPRYPDMAVAGEVPVEFWRREMIWRVDHRIGRADWTPWGGVALEPAVIDDGMRSPLIDRAKARDPELAKFLRFARLPLAKAERVPAGTKVELGDARFDRIRAGFGRSVILPPER